MGPSMRHHISVDNMVVHNSIRPMLVVEDDRTRFKIHAVQPNEFMIGDRQRQPAVCCGCSTMEAELARSCSLCLKCTTVIQCTHLVLTVCYIQIFYLN